MEKWWTIHCGLDDSMLPVMAKGCQESRQCHQMVSLESYMCSVSSFDAMIGCSNRSGMADTGMHLHADCDVSTLLE